MPELSDDDILDALGVEQETMKTTSHTPREKRILAGFEEIQRFFDRLGHVQDATLAPPRNVLLHFAPQAHAQ